MKKIALFPVEKYQRDKLSVMDNQELLQIADTDADVQVYEIAEFTELLNDECYFMEDWCFPIDYPDVV